MPARVRDRRRPDRRVQRTRRQLLLLGLARGGERLAEVARARPRGGELGIERIVQLAFQHLLTLALCRHAWSMPPVRTEQPRSVQLGKVARRGHAGQHALR
jgi:hypothetical protein